MSGNVRWARGPERPLATFVRDDPNTSICFGVGVEDSARPLSFLRKQDTSFSGCWDFELGKTLQASQNVSKTCQDVVNYMIVFFVVHEVKPFPKIPIVALRKDVPDTFLFVLQEECSV